MARPIINNFYNGLFFVYMFSVLGCFVSVVYGLQCYTCVNAPTHEECVASGQLVTCKSNENSCATEIRWISKNMRQQITKRCKQRQACFNNMNVGKCIARAPNSMCYCCCVEDRCNVDDQHCNGQETVNIKVSDDSSTANCHPELRTRHGTVVCKNANYRGSKCLVHCNRGYVSGKYGDTVCQKYGRWRNPLSSCRPIRCESNHTKLLNGVVRCTKRNLFGSTCRYDCKAGYQLRGSTRSTCVLHESNFSSGKWNRPKPTCIAVPGNCPNLEPVANSHVECTNTTNVGSECQYNCEDDYDMIGPYLITCQDNGTGQVPTWSADPPTCRKLCPNLIQSDHLETECSDGNSEGSVCSFKCEKYYDLVGRDSITCQELGSGRKQWDFVEPTCLKRCPVLTELRNGQTVCSSDRNLGSQCNFICDELFDLIGDNMTSCTVGPNEEAIWDQSVPVCRKQSCPKVPEIAKGYWDCSDANYVGSTCYFNCTEDYKVLPLHSEQLLCLKETLKWNNPAPCCSRICPLSPNIDLVIALDSSSSVGQDGWDIMIKFLQELVSLYDFSENTTCVAVFRYNKKVDKENVIPFNYVKVHGKQALLRKIAAMPYSGSGTNTGKALEFAGQTMFTAHEGDRDHSANVLIVLTDGKSNDNVVQPSQILREKNVLTYVVGIKSEKRTLDINQLQSIAGRPQNLFLTKNGYRGLGKDFAKDLAQITSTKESEPAADRKPSEKKDIVFASSSLTENWAMYRNQIPGPSSTFADTRFPTKRHFDAKTGHFQQQPAKLQIVQERNQWQQCYDFGQNWGPQQPPPPPMFNYQEDQNYNPNVPPYANYTAPRQPMRQYTPYTGEPYVRGASGRSNFHAAVPQPSYYINKEQPSMGQWQLPTIAPRYPPPSTCTSSFETQQKAKIPSQVANTKTTVVKIAETAKFTVPDDNKASSSKENHNSENNKILDKAQAISRVVKENKVFVAANVHGIHAWAELKPQVLPVFEFIGKLDSQVTAVGQYTKGFEMEDGQGQRIECVFYETDRELKPMRRGKTYRCVGEFNTKKNHLLCVSVRETSQEEMREHRKCIALCNRTLKQRLAKRNLDKL